MIFVDTGPLLARFLEKDQHHRQALATWNTVKNQSIGCVTSSFVIGEFVTLLSRRAGSAFATKCAKPIWNSPTFTILRPTQADEIEALDLMAQYHDQDFSFTDALSFVLMKQQHITSAFSFDNHFRTVGFSLWPE